MYRNVSWRVSRLARRNTATREERGGVVLIVGVLVSMGVVFGMLSLSLDMGQMMMEKRQLQNGADATAMYLARACAENSQCNVVTSNGVTSTLNANNSSTNSNSISLRCWYNMPSGLANTSDPGCPATDSATSGAFADCSPAPSGWSTTNPPPYVVVKTQSKAAGSSGLRNWIAPLIGGSADSKVGSCSRAAWGAPYPGGGGDIPITISACTWQLMTGGTVGGGGGQYYGVPDYTTYPTIGNGANQHPAGYGGAGAAGTAPQWPVGALPPATTPTAIRLGQENVVMIQNPPGSSVPAASCPSWNGHPLPGGFSVLSTVAGNPCKINLQPFNWVQTDPGNNTSCDLSQYVGKVIDVPVFDCTYGSGTAPTIEPTNPLQAALAGCTTGNGSNAWYHLAGYASFYLSGYRMVIPAQPDNNVLSINPFSSGPPGNGTLGNSNNPCPNGNACLSGWFTTGELSVTAIHGGLGGGGGYYGTVGIVPGG